MIVRITRADQGEIREAGRLRLDGAAVRIEPAMPEDRPLLEHILSEPTVIEVERVPVSIHADREPQRFLERLCRAYSGKLSTGIQARK